MYRKWLKVKLIRPFCFQQLPLLRATTDAFDESHPLTRPVIDLKHRHAPVHFTSRSIVTSLQLSCASLPVCQMNHQNPSVIMQSSIILTPEQDNYLSSPCVSCRSGGSVEGYLHSVYEWQVWCGVQTEDGQIWPDLWLHLALLPLIYLSTVDKCTPPAKTHAPPPPFNQPVWSLMVQFDSGITLQDYVQNAVCLKSTSHQKSRPCGLIKINPDLLGVFRNFSVSCKSPNSTVCSHCCVCICVYTDQGSI